MSETILALDMATTCGWADNHGNSGVCRLQGKGKQSDGYKFRSFLMFLEHTRIECREFDRPIKFIAFEQVRRHMGVQAAHVYGGFLAVLQSFCDMHEVEYRGFSVQDIKIFATDKGNASKDEMMAAARVKWPEVNIIDDNHADALWLLETCLAFERGDPIGRVKKITKPRVKKALTAGLF
ncbi:MAG: hypothetical protein ABJA67_06735 [Chthonomonadales bacterium]